MSHKYENLKRYALLALTSLVIAYVRTGLQYGHYSWKSVWEFLASWLIHYVATIIVVAITLICIKFSEGFFLGKEKEQSLSVEQAFIYIPIVLLIIAIIIYIVTHYIPSDSYLDDL